jgi:AraC-like DNA-binding protein/mannose-6-phosphate isomerase-like protein (cupin superfamily)
MAKSRQRNESKSAKTHAREPHVDESFLAYARPAPKPFKRFVSGHFPGGTISQPHSHPCIALHGCLQGPLTLIAEDENFELDAGTFYLLAPGVRHYWHNAGKQTAATIAVLIDTAQVGVWSPESGVKECCRELDALVTSCHRFNAAQDSELHHTFWLVADHLTAVSPREPAASCGALLTLLGQILAGLKKESTETPAPPDDIAQRARLLLLSRVNDRLSINEVAVALGVSPTKIKDSFRQAFGCGIIAYHNQLKIWQAKRFLSERGLTIEQVSRKLGFSTASYFSQVFLEHTGESPTTFRERCVHEKNGTAKETTKKQQKV